MVNDICRRDHQAMTPFNWWLTGELGKTYGLVHLSLTFIIPYSFTTARTADFPWGTCRVLSLKEEGHRIRPLKLGGGRGT